MMGGSGPCSMGTGEGHCYPEINGSSVCQKCGDAGHEYWNALLEIPKFTVRDTKIHF